MRSHEYDVVVVGGGIAGLAASLAASEAGRRVAVLERASESETGGNTRYTEAFLRMKSMDAPADGFEESLLSDFMGHPDPGIAEESLHAPDRRSALSRSHHVVDPDVVGTLADRAAETLTWLTGYGVRFEQLPTPFMTTSTTRLAPVGGGLALVETLGKAARDRGVDFHFRTAARDLVTEDGRVLGIEASAPGGRARFTGNVVLACGGFQGNAEMTARFLGPGALTCRPVARGGNYNKGEGIEMALAAGAAAAGNFSMFHAEPVDPRSGAPEAAIFCFPYGILVNRSGERFVDEAPAPVDACYERITRVVHRQRDGIAYVILDARAMSIPNIASAIRTDQPPITATSLNELATRLGLPEDRFVRTVHAYNGSCTDGVFDHTKPDGLATGDLLPPKSNWARPLDQAPFTALPVMAANVFTFGGLKTNAHAEVIDRDGDPIRGLYAAGEITGLYYSNYTGSTSVLRGGVFGRIAGRTAAEQAGEPAGREDA